MSEIKAKALVCPCCNAPLQLKDTGYGEINCKYCGAILYISREDTDEKGNMQIVNEVDGRPLATINIPIGWDVIHRYIDDSTPTTVYPYAINIDISNNANSMIHIQTGQTYQTIGQIAYNNRQDEFTVQSPFKSIEQYMNNLATSYANPRKMRIVSVEDRSLPIEGIDKKAEFEKHKMEVESEVRKAQMTSNGYQIGIVGLYCDKACRVYHLEGNNNEKKILAFYTGVDGQNKNIRNRKSYGWC